LPLKPGSHVIVVSSGAALNGSPLSGGYASAKRAQWFIAEYAAKVSKDRNLGIRFSCVLPALNPNTDLGRAAVVAYAHAAGVEQTEFVKRFGPPLTPEIAGNAIADLHANPTRWTALAYTLSGAGLAPIP
jgi:NAD(P)-dependent dehydrogenase (short-subunit alcohol dehydrogenase family)